MTEKYLTAQANKWVLDKILNVDKVVVYTHLDVSIMQYKIGYVCVRRGEVVLKMTFDDDVPLQDRVTAMQVALRINNGNDSQGQESCPPKVT